jgi:hypothetical protein
MRERRGRMVLGAVEKHGMMHGRSVRRPSVMKADPHFYRPDGRTGDPCGACSELMAQLTLGKARGIQAMLDYENLCLANRIERPF